MRTNGLSLPLLTDTQTVILYLATKRLPVSDIAERLQLSEREVDIQLSRALEKLKQGTLEALFHQIIHETQNSITHDASSILQKEK